MADLMQASAQQMNRPKDERFPTLSALAQATMTRRKASIEVDVPKEDFTKVRASVSDEGLITLGGHALNSWTAQQLCSRVSAPYGYLRKLPVDLTAACLNQGLITHLEDDTNHRDTSLLITPSTDTQSSRLRAITSTSYTRIWDHEVVAMLMEHAVGFGPPRLFGREGTEGRNGSGLYAGDRDMFAFMVNEDDRIDIPGGDSLGRGFFVWNSEVGASSFGFMTFLFNYVCCNHIVWGAAEIEEFKVRHVGKAREMLMELPKALETLRMRGGKMREQELILQAMTLEFGTGKSSVTEDIQRHAAQHKVKLTQHEIAGALDMAAQEEDLHPGTSPHSLWGVVQGLTAYARDIPFAEKRVDVETRAGKLLPALV
jgi:hypothetical protein